MVGLLLLLAVAGLKSFRDLESARERQRGLERRIEETRRSNRQLKRRIEFLADDPATLERLAREQLGMVRAGDVVIVLSQEPRTPVADTRP